MKKPDIQELAIASQKGDLDAYEQLVIRFQETLSSFLQALGADITASEDLTQQTFLQAHKSLPKLKDTAMFQSWLFGIGKNLFLRSLKEEPDKEDVARVKGRKQDTKVIKRRNVVLGEVQGLILEQSEPYRELLLLRYYQGYSAKQMAAKLDRPIGTITKQLSRAHQLVSDGLQGIEGHTTTLGYWMKKDDKNKE